MAEKEHFSKEEVARIADLAKIKLDYKQIEKMTTDLNVINEAIAKVQEVATEDVEATSHPLQTDNPSGNVLREDIPATFENDLLTNEEAIAGAPKTEQGMFLAPQILVED
ncbi:MAG: Asp-tRNA(Asn)/Glu-tRNA(Gln) amidotransferase subunit GatC [Candidatus Ancillula sp.]|jgi:aspartyl-tRNA(Asn)/glutamyl-tRNA(Gln) amidotransferase subunit C|nr:Asp-tRNA(Asn)/Glu-tRNA(Gln) amidotransferase subunit GatC [Candidatus Ancillula sp.]